MAVTIPFMPAPSAADIARLEAAFGWALPPDYLAFVRAHAANSLNVQISMFIWLVIAAVLYVILGIVTLGIGFLVFLPVFAVPLVIAGVLHVIGAVKAYNGEWWNPPFTARFVK